MTPDPPSPDDRLRRALDLYRAAVDRTPAGSAPPDPAPFLTPLSAADRDRFAALISSTTQTLAAPPADPAQPTGQYDAPPDRPETQSFANDPLASTADPDTPADPGRTKVVGEYESDGRGEFALGSGLSGEGGPRSAHADKLSEYEILAELGHGGMGVVYKARQTRLNRLVALKMVLAGGRASAAQLARFTAEARAVAKLDHPNLVRVIDIGDHDGLPFFAMEFVEGGALDTHLRKHSLEPKDAARLMERVCRAMHYAHTKGVIHRDLKPANILLAPDKSPKITDFGLAKQQDDSEAHTRTGAVMGTPNYMAPEQAEGKTKHINHLADVYSLGATLYELMTGRPPFSGPSAVAVLAQVRSSEPVNPSRLQPGVPKDLETICLKAMQKEAGKRYPSAESLADDLQRYIDGQPILARPVSSVEKVVRWARRKPVQAGLTFAVLGLSALLVASAVVYGLNLRAKNEVIEGKNRDLEVKNIEIEGKNVALAAEKAEVEKQANATADRVRFLMRNVVETLTRLGLADQRVPLTEFVRKDLERLTAVTGENAGIRDRVLIGALVTLGQQYQEDARNATDPTKRKQLLEDAEKQYRLAVERAEGVAQANPDSDLARGNLALALTRRGSLALDAGHPDAAAEDIAAGLKLRKEIVDAPKSPAGTRDHLFPADARASLAESHFNLGELARRTGRAADARRHYQDAIADREEALRLAEAGAAQPGGAKWTETTDGLAGFRRGLAAVYSAYSLTLAADPAKALEYARKAAEMREKVTAGLPASIPDRLELASAHGWVGDLCLFQGKPGDAAGPYQKNFVHLTQATAPSDVRKNWAMAYYRLGAAQQMTNHRAEAKATFERCLSIREELAQTAPTQSNLINLMLAQVRAGRPEAAAATLRETADKYPTTVPFVFNAGATYALAAEAVEAAAGGKLTWAQRLARGAYLNLAWQYVGRLAAVPAKYAEVRTDPDYLYLQKQPDFATRFAALRKK
ncbi:MAG: serine/threonine-protein kinase [Gemmataceae bacterium]